MVATVTVTGHLGTDPERFRTHTGVEYARFRMAHTPRLRRDGEWVDGETIWLTVRCYGKLARNVGSLRSGDPVLVTGQWRFEEWADRNGVARSTQVIMADAVGPNLTRCLVSVLPPVKDEPSTAHGVAGAAQDAGGATDHEGHADQREDEQQESDQPVVDQNVRELLTSRS